MQDALCWDKRLIVQGQYWRVLSGNFTHSNLIHLVMNLIAFALIMGIFKPSTAQLLIGVLFIALVIGLLNLLTSMQIYLGLSGVLHGLFVYFALLDIRNGHKNAWLLVLAILAKLAWENIFAPSAFTERLIEASVATAAHLFGLLAGVLLALLILGWGRLCRGRCDQKADKLT